MSTIDRLIRERNNRVEFERLMEDRKKQREKEEKEFWSFLVEKEETKEKQEKRAKKEEKVENKEENARKKENIPCFEHKVVEYGHATVLYRNSGNKAHRIDGEAFKKAKQLQLKQMRRRLQAKKQIRIEMESKGFEETSRKIEAVSKETTWEQLNEWHTMGFKSKSNN